VIDIRDSSEMSYDVLTEMLTTHSLQLLLLLMMMMMMKMMILV